MFVTNASYYITENNKNERPITHILNYVFKFNTKHDLVFDMYYLRNSTLFNMNNIKNAVVYEH
jgi:hypothetical protein